MIDEAITDLTPLTGGVRAACRAVGRPQASHYRRHRPVEHPAGVLQQHPHGDPQVQPGAVLTDEDEPLKLCRLTWRGSPDTWHFAIYEYSGDRYADSLLPGGGWTGTPEAALDCACGLYLNDPSAYFEPQKD
jgi:hypothetical protein